MEEEESPETYEGRQSTIKDNRRITCISSAKDLDDVLEVEKLEKVPRKTDPPASSCRRGSRRRRRTTKQMMI